MVNYDWTDLNGETAGWDRDKDGCHPERQLHVIPSVSEGSPVRHSWLATSAFEKIPRRYAPRDDRRAVSGRFTVQIRPIVVPTNYPSARRATTGSMRVLERAGMIVASAATHSSRPATSVRVNASVGLTS